MFDRILDRCIDCLDGLRNFVLRVASGLSRGRPTALGHLAVGVARWRSLLIALAVAGLAGYLVWEHPPVQTVPRGELAVRSNLFTGRVSQFGEGSLWALPGLHQVRRFPIRDQVYRPAKSSKASGEAPFQSVEGLSLGVNLAVRYAIDPAQISRLARSLPEDYAGEVVEPAVQGVIYPLFARYTVREIFSSKRSEIQQAIEAQLRPKLASDGILLKSVQMGQVDLPQDYRNGMDKLLAEELESEKMRFTLELMNKRVQQTALEGEAEKVRRQKAAEAAGNEQVIAAKAQEEAMAHVLPFKQKQIQQRGLEAEADKVARIRQAEANADARRIEASGEADSRQKLADAEVYRLERVNKVNSEQMEREGVLISQNPLLIQKTLADKLSDKVQVIIAPPPTSGGFIGSTLLGGK
jgi:regulator of protease activity HflC (stomatin/prohibitin superfamily)